MQGRMATEVISVEQWGDKGSHTVKPINPLKATRVVACQMKSTSEKKSIVLTLSLRILLASAVMFTPK